MYTTRKTYVFWTNFSIIFYNHNLGYDEFCMFDTSMYNSNLPLFRIESTCMVLVTKAKNLNAMEEQNKL